MEVTRRNRTRPRDCPRGGAAVKRSTTKLKRASVLYAKAGFSPELQRLFNQQWTRGQCAECGVKPIERDHLCARCWGEYPKITNVGEPVNGWQWRIRQANAAYLGSAFWLERSGVYEREGRSQFIGLFDSFDEARQAAGKKLGRSIRAAEIAMGTF